MRAVAIGGSRLTAAPAAAWGLGLAVAAILAVRAALAANLGLTDDEAYYRLWALAPALSYYDHPPMVGWWIAAGRAIGGDTALGVRLMQLLAFVVGSAALWRATALLYNARTAAWATWFSLAMPLMGVGGLIITPDAATVLAWTLTLWALAELRASDNANWWLAVGAAAGLGLLAKYTNLFLGAGIGVWLLAVPALRRQLGTWQIWAGGALAGLCALPVIIWNAEHGWASFAKQFGRVTRGHELTGLYLAELCGAALALASPVIAVLAVAGFAKAMRRALVERNSSDTLLVAMTAPALAYFLIHALHDRVQANWIAPLYPLFAIAAAVAVERLIAPRYRSLVVATASGLGLAMTGLLYVHAVSPLDGGRLGKDPTRQLHGWPEFAQEVDRVRGEAGAQWIATSSYAVTGQLAFALRDRATVVQLDERIRYVHLPPPDATLVRQPALYIERLRRLDERLLRQRFASVQRLGDLKRPASGSTLETYAVYLVAQPFGDPLH